MESFIKRYNLSTHYTYDVNMNTKKPPVVTQNGPKAIGPYSVGINAGPFVFTAGQIGLKPETGNLAEGGIEAETNQALNNIKEILKAAGSDMSLVVKTTVYMTDLSDFSKMNDCYGKFFTENPPARSIAEVKALPRGAKIEIDAIALLSEGCC